MSLINDALKRAAEAQKRHGDASPNVVLEPVSYAARPTLRVRLLALLLISALICAAGFFFVKWNQALDHQEATTAAMARMVQLRLTSAIPNVAPREVPPTKQSSSSEPPTNGSRIRVSTNLLVRTNWVAMPPAGEPPPQEVASARGLPLEPGNSDPTAGVVAPVAQEPKAVNEVPSIPPATNAPALRLQSIIYRLKNPAAVINGEMVEVGDKLKEGRVLKIDRYSVTVEWRGETNELALPRL